jgi:hypothetical protein
MDLDMRRRYEIVSSMFLVRFRKNSLTTWDDEMAV